MFALVTGLLIQEKGSHVRQRLHQLGALRGILQTVTIKLLQQTKCLLAKRLNYLLHGLLSKQGKGIGNQVRNILEIIGRCRQRHIRFLGHCPMAHITDAFAHDDPQRRFQNTAATLLTAFTTSLTALILNVGH